MYLNLYGNHFSYINNVSSYFSSYKCDKCCQLSKRKDKHADHVASCVGGQVHRYCAGIYRPSPTVFEELDDWGISTPEHLRYYNYHAAYDFEALMERNEGEKCEQYTDTHRILSVSIASNVPGYENPTCFVRDDNSDEKAVVRCMIEHLRTVSSKARELLLPQYTDIFTQIGSKLREVDQLPRKRKLSQSASDSKDTSTHPLKILNERLDKWLSELPVLGFNSARYDLRMIHSVFIPVLIHDMKLKIDSVVVADGRMMALGVGGLKFLDVLNYLAPGFNYSKFLKCYNVEESKGIFCYSYMTSLDKLKETELPPREAFFSSLTRQHITAEEYAECQRVWKDKNMRTLRDYLVEYNNKDTRPFIVALENMFAFYRDNMKVDPFKSALSVPGISLKVVFNSIQDPDAFFHRFHKTDADLDDLIHDQVVGGPALIFHRYHEAGKTKIRENEYGRDAAKDVEAVLGYDANALYLWSLMQKMPCGMYIRRRGPEFKPKYPSSSSLMSREFLEWTAKEENVRIRHQFNGGEFRVGSRRLPVDGFCEATNQFQPFTNFMVVFGTVMAVDSRQTKTRLIK